MIISGIDICFVAHLNSMAEALFLTDYEQCEHLCLQICLLILSLHVFILNYLVGKSCMHVESECI